MRDRLSLRMETGVQVIEGSFGPNGSSAIDQTKVKGHGFSVVYTSTGLFTITLTEKVLSLVDAQVTLQLASAAAVRVLIGAVSLSAKTVQILVTAMDGTTLSDAITSAAGSRINFTLSVKRTAAI